jgi:hypothetical protein
MGGVYLTWQIGRDERVELFLTTLSQGGTVTAAAEKANIGRRTVYDWKEADPDFAAQFEDAYQRGIAVLEDEAVRRAYHGVQRPVYQRGVVAGHVTEYSDSLLMFLLKSRDPRFRDKATVEMTGAGGGPIKTEGGLDLAKLSTDELRHLYAIAQRAAIKVA